MKTLFFALSFSAVVFAVDFSDNFDSYTPGSDLNESVYWLRADPCGNLVVTQNGSGNILETEWNANTFTGYACLGSQIWSDGVVTADVVINGSETLFGLVARGNPITGESYLGGLYRVYGTIGATFVAYIDSTGNYDLLTNDYFYPVNDDTWYTLSFEITGSNPTHLKVSVNGTVNSDIVDNEHSMTEGLSGLGGGYESSEPVVRVDDFSVLDLTSALTNTTFAAIKASFSRGNM